MKFDIARRLKDIRRSLNKGFTLIELAIVGLFLGLLAVFAISQFSGSATDNTRANSLVEASQKLADNWSLIAQQCGISTDVTAVSLTGGASAADNNLSLLVGNASPSATYTSCINLSGVRAMSGLTTGAAGAEKVNDFVVDLNTPSAGKFGVAYQAVPDQLALVLWTKLTGQTTLPAAADATTAPNAITLGAPTSGKRTVTLVRAL